MAHETNVYDGKNVFVILPTGFGKSLIYAIDTTLLATDHSMIVVISPLTETSIPSALQPQDLMIFIVYCVTLGNGYVIFLHKSRTGMTPDPSSLAKGLARQTKPYYRD